MTTTEFISLRNIVISSIMLAVFTSVSLLAWLMCALFISLLILFLESEYEYESEPEIAIKHDENDHAKLKSAKSPDTFLFKIRYGKILKRLNVPMYDGNFDIEMDELRARIYHIFGLPVYSKLEISYIDEDEELIIMTDDNDLTDIMTQKKLQYRLRMYVELGKSEATTQGHILAGFMPIHFSSTSGLNPIQFSSNQTTTQAGLNPVHVSSTSEYNETTTQAGIGGLRPPIRVSSPSNFGPCFDLPSRSELVDLGFTNMTHEI